MESDRSKVLAAVAYILTWLTGLIIYLVADPAPATIKASKEYQFRCNYEKR